jgi:hypothetical protein
VFQVSQQLCNILVVLRICLSDLLSFIGDVSLRADGSRQRSLLSVGQFSGTMVTRPHLVAAARTVFHEQEPVQKSGLMLVKRPSSTSRPYLSARCPLSARPEAARCVRALQAVVCTIVILLPGGGETLEGVVRTYSYRHQIALRAKAGSFPPRTCVSVLQNFSPRYLWRTCGDLQF